MDISDRALKMMDGMFDMFEPASDASFAVSIYASFPASLSKNNLTIPVLKFVIIFGICTMAQKMKITAIIESI